MGGVVLNNALKATLLSLQNTSNLVDDVTLRLASGLKVNSALDNPQNFFSASALDDRASDLTRLLDGVSQSIRAVELASGGLEATSKLIDQAESLAFKRIAEIEAIDVPHAFEGESGLSRLITEAGADFYFKLDDESGPAVDSGDVGVGASYGASVGRGADGLFDGSNGSSSFNGVSSFVNVGYDPLLSGGFTQKSIELVFNADSISGRQVIYSQGNAARGIDIYLDGNQLYITATASPFFGSGAPLAQPVFQETIETGRNYHVALVFSQAQDRLEGYLNGQSIGESSVGNAVFYGHAAPVFGRNNTAAKSFHDGVSSSFHFFEGSISDVAIHNSVLSDEAIADHARAAEANTFNSVSQEYSDVIEQIRRTAIDSNYRSFDLLRGKSIRTDFNPSGSSFLLTEGVNIAEMASGLPQSGFHDVDDLNVVVEKLRDFRKTVRSFAKSLTSDLTVIKTRENFTQNIVSTLKAGRDDLTLSDQNKDGASLLALQTRQQLGVTALSLAAQSAQQALRLF